MTIEQEEQLIKRVHNLEGMVMSLTAMIAAGGNPLQTIMVDLRGAKYLSALRSMGLAPDPRVDFMKEEDSLNKFTKWEEKV